MPEPATTTPDENTETPDGADPTADTTGTENAPENRSQDDSGGQEPDTFSREYVTKLRDENARYRQRAGRVDELSRLLHHSLVAATGRLADPDDLPFDETHLDDDGKLTEAIDELLNRKPHLASRRPDGDVGQGARGETDSVGLAGLLRARA
jgi:hypothetical protein